jgi:hypothetical protein
LAHGIKINIELNQKWSRRADGGRDIFMSLHDGVGIKDFIRTQANFSVKACLIKPDLLDSSAFKNDIPLLRKSLSDKSLQKALIYFHEEVLDHERPLYGIYKAVEELCSAVGGRKNLGLLAGKDTGYVDDLMQTAQTIRHARTQARQMLTSDECKNRAKILIESYANSI